MKIRTFIVCCMLLAASIMLYAADVKVEQMSTGEVVHFLKGVSKVVYSSDNEDRSVLAFVADNGQVLYECVIQNSTKITFDSADDQTAIADVMQDGNVSIYPNPAVDCININGLTEQVSAELFTLDGNKMLSVQTSGTVDVSSVAQGTYILRVDKRYFKVIIQE